jgi:long-chain acyl-CoA synthetase
LFEKILAGVYRGVAKKPFFTRTLFRTMLGTVRGVRRTFGWKWGSTLFHGLREKAGLDSIRIMISGAAALPPHVAYDFNDLGLMLMQGYGLTEASPVLTVNPIDRAKMASVGLPIPGVELRILDPDEEGIGHVAARGDMVMRGYYRNPGATAETLRDGWLYTGDSGRIDEEGYLYITGRLKNVIVTRGGKNVYPEEVEQVLGKSPFILELLVRGVPMADGGGEEVEAIVVPDYEYFDQYAQHRGTPLAEGEVEMILKREVALACADMADYKRVKRFQIREEEFPKTSTRKIKRFLFQHQPVSVQEDT